jgi:uncharacterized protein (DUF1330 family)
MTAYAMAHVHSTNFGQELIEYLRRIDATLEPFEGRFLVHGGPVDAVEGTWNGDLIIIEFPDLDSARGWYESPEYLKIRHLRTENTTADTIIFEGLPTGYLAKSALDHLPRRRARREFRHPPTRFRQRCRPGDGNGRGRAAANADHPRRRRAGFVAVGAESPAMKRKPPSVRG